MQFPNDDDGDVLRSLHSKGIDLSKPRTIDFYCYAENKPLAFEIVEHLKPFGFDSSVFENESAKSSKKRYSVYCSKEVIPSYENIIRIQSELNDIFSLFNTSCDGWGTLS